jgi:outer membrane immunogenic protein
MPRLSIIALALSSCLAAALAAAETAAAQSQEQAKAGAATPGQAAHAQANSEHNWRGLHIGVNLGAMGGKFSGPLTIAAVPGAPSATTPFSVRNTSFTAGGQAGYNWQISRTVIGIEGDFDRRNLSGTQTLGATAPPEFVPGDFFSARSRFKAFIRGRIGYTWNNWLLYGTGGVAFARMSMDANFIQVGIFPASSGSDTNTLVGGTVGAGVEYALAKHWSAGAEYLYSDYRKATSHLGTVAAFGPPFELAAATASAGQRTQEGAVKLNFKF